ncbi:hypothetical protein HDV05_007306 [Chytridiales sp. JEL 0842]|nr:hypothetical protein HDV05_007306 [Chytridiales sp. JEL 0842]
MRVQLYALLVMAFAASVHAGSLILASDLATVQMMSQGNANAHFRARAANFTANINPNITVVDQWRSFRNTIDDYMKMYEWGSGVDTLTINPSPLKWAAVLRANRWANLTSLWQNYPYNVFPSQLKDACTYTAGTNTMQYCVPTSFFIEKLWYRPSVFAYHGLAVPNDWDSLLNACDVFARKGKPMIHVGLKDYNWHVQYMWGAIFRRLHGPEKYETLLIGNTDKVTWLGPEVQETFEYWEQMVKRGCFGSYAYQKNLTQNDITRLWNTTVEESTSALTFSPSWFKFAFVGLPEPLIDGEFPSMAMPRLREGIPMAEAVTADAIAVTNNKRLSNTLQFVEFLSNADAHAAGVASGAIPFSYIPGIGNANTSDLRILRSADKITQPTDNFAPFSSVSFLFTTFENFLNDTSIWRPAVQRMHNMYIEFVNKTSPPPTIAVNTTTSGPMQIMGGKQVYYDRAIISIVPTSANSRLFYTLDGSDPIAGTSTLYQGFITVLAPLRCAPVTTVIKAISTKDTLASSSVVMFNVTVAPFPEVCAPDRLTISTGVMVGAIISMVILVIIAALIFVFQKSDTLRHASPTFCLLITGGCLLVSGSVIVYTANPNISAGTCTGFLWLFVTGFSVIMGSAFAKNWRIYKIFNNVSLAKTNISNASLMRIIAASVAINFVILAIWTGVDFPKPQIHPIYNYSYCGSDNDVVQKALTAIIIVYNAGLLLLACVFGVLTSSADERFNEAKSMTAAVYNAAVMAVFAIAIGSIESLTINFRTGGVLVCILVGATLTPMILYGGKLYSVVSHTTSESLSETTSTVKAVTGTNLFHKRRSSVVKIKGLVPCSYMQAGLFSQWNAGHVGFENWFGSFRLFVVQSDLCRVEYYYTLGAAVQEGGSHRASEIGVSTMTKAAVNNAIFDDASFTLSLPSAKNPSKRFNIQLASEAEYAVLKGTFNNYKPGEGGKVIEATRNFGSATGSGSA